MLPWIKSLPLFKNFLEMICWFKQENVYKQSNIKDVLKELSHYKDKRAKGETHQKYSYFGSYWVCPQPEDILIQDRYLFVISLFKIFFSPWVSRDSSWTILWLQVKTYYLLNSPLTCISFWVNTPLLGNPSHPDPHPEKSHFQKERLTSIEFLKE